MRSLRLFVLGVLLALFPTLALTVPALADDPYTTVTLVVTPDAATVGSPITAIATVTRFGTPASTGRVAFGVERDGFVDYDATSASSNVVDGMAHVTLQGGLVAGSRTMVATYFPTTGLSTESARVTFTVNRAITTTTLVLSPHPSMANRLEVTPTISHAGGAITRGECSMYIDDVQVSPPSGGYCGTAPLPYVPPGTHTVRINYVGTPYGIPSDDQLYEPSSGTASFIVAAPAPVVALPPPAVAKVTTTTTVSVAKVVRTPKSAVVKVAVAASDRSRTLGPITLKITGTRTLSKKAGLRAGKATVRIKLKPGRYQVTAIYSGTPGSTSPTVSFKVK